MDKLEYKQGRWYLYVDSFGSHVYHITRIRRYTKTTQIQYKYWTPGSRGKAVEVFDAPYIDTSAFANEITKEEALLHIVSTGG